MCDMWSRKRPLSSFAAVPGKRKLMPIGRTICAAIKLYYHGLSQSGFGDLLQTKCYTFGNGGLVNRGKSGDLDSSVECALLHF